MVVAFGQRPFFCGTPFFLGVTINAKPHRYAGVYPEIMLNPGEYMTHKKRNNGLVSGCFSVVVYITECV